MAEFVIANQVQIFISLEMMSFIFLIIFLLVRYALTKQKISGLFLFLFILCIVLEAVLALFIYQQTGEISKLQIVIAIFVVYAFTFGIADFKKLDRYIKQKVGNWKGVNLLTENDRRKIEHAKDPKVIARKSRVWWYTHAFIFVVAHYIFWKNYGDHTHNLMYYLSDLSWWGEESLSNSPFVNEMILQVSRLWTIIFAVDTIVSWSDTFFPSKKK